MLLEDQPATSAHRITTEGFMLRVRLTKACPAHWLDSGTHRRSTRQGSARQLLSTGVGSGGTGLGLPARFSALCNLQPWKLTSRVLHLQIRSKR